MAIDFIIDYDCIPKQTLTTDGILERIKWEERAFTIIELFRERGDERPPSEMGFEFTRSTPDGQEETQIIVVQHLLDQAEELKPLQQHCVNCPANRLKRPYGCMSFVQYPITAKAEQWMLDQLPVPDEPLIWMLLRQGVKEFDYDGKSIEPMRASGNTYFESQEVYSRRLGEFTINANQLFEMIFAVGHVNPNHGALILLFLGGINRDLEADEIMKIAPARVDAEFKYPFALKITEDDDRTITEIKGLLEAFYYAWKLNVHLILDV